MATRNAAREKAAAIKLTLSPKYAEERGVSFGRLLVFLMNALPREQKTPFLAGFADTVCRAMGMDDDAQPTTKAAARRKGRK